MIFVVLFIYLMSSTLGMVFIRMGAAGNALALSRESLSFSLSHFTWIGVLLYVVSFLLWVYILQRFNLSYISPLMAGISYITIALASYFILHEHITPMQLVGMIVIIVGVLLMNYDKLFHKA